MGNVRIVLQTLWVGGAVPTTKTRTITPCGLYLRTAVQSSTVPPRLPFRCRRTFAYIACVCRIFCISCHDTPPGGVTLQNFDPHVHTSYVEPSYGEVLQHCCNYQVLYNKQGGGDERDK